MNSNTPLFFTCLKCKSIPKITLSSLSALSINCECGYSQIIDINDYIAQIKAMNTPKEKVFCIQCQHWMDKTLEHKEVHVIVNSEVKTKINCDKHSPSI